MEGPSVPRSVFVLAADRRKGSLKVDEELSPVILSQRRQHGLVLKFQNPFEGGTASEETAWPRLDPVGAERLPSKADRVSDEAVRRTHNRERCVLAWTL